MSLSEVRSGEWREESSVGRLVQNLTTALSTHLKPQILSHFKANCPANPADDAIAVPLRLFGDEGPYYKKKSLFILSFGSFFPHSGNSLLTRLLLCPGLKQTLTLELL